ncbi:hypothetical protein [Micromonospora psammae]|uniref:hypothetical protein n=1 Tax=Micromonospora sp. CPCC 205556 TaxID=3122398 RepID=UPI002FF2D7C5
MMRSLVPVAVLGALLWGGRGAVRAWRSPGGWVRLALITASCTLLLYVYGLFSRVAYDIGETCDWLGQHYDTGYRAEHWREPGRWFPLHNRCNAGYDLVPTYVNPSLVVLAVLTLGCAVMAVTLTVTGRRRR